ncbi:MAG: hypothetical protein CEN90_417 [Parcubacteria group bacterium Licking1014_17]|nr:MAG: hypothetical protein CEN90_417 [Parcubacteria group bacterium Licking1014_17]
MYNSYGASGLDIIRDTFTSLWGSVVNFLPQLIAAILVFIIGWIVAIIIGKLVWHLVRIIQLDKILESIGFKKIWDRSGYKLDSPIFFYELVKWFFIIVSLMAATDILGLDQVTEFLQTVVLYLPNVFVAAIVLIIGALVAKFAEGLVRGSMKAAKLASANFLGSIARWAVLIFSFLIALEKLEVGTDIIRTAIMGIIAAAALAAGIAFGLGGKEHADSLIGDLRKHVND